MRLHNLRDRSEIVSFRDAARRGSAGKGGLYWPVELPAFTAAEIDALLAAPFVEASIAVLDRLVGDEFAPGEVAAMVRRAFDFALPVVPIEPRIAVLELFHGPTLAFKDFGARFMAQALARVAGEGRLTILTATSGDTGAAVAHAFHGIQNIDVVVLYPAGLISRLQEALFCTLGGNVRTVRVAGRFDDCQALVKECFNDAALTAKLGLTSANSINFSRLVAQSCYYFGAVGAWRRQVGTGEVPVIAVPSGNFGDLTAGLLAWRLGLPVRRFIAATNANDVVPQYLAGGAYRPRPSVATLANAMDVGAPNNWERIVALFGDDERGLRAMVRGGSVADDATILDEMRWWDARGYLCDPHTAVALRVLRHQLGEGERGIALSTAHPAKFAETVARALGREIPLPPALAAVADRPLLSVDLPNDVGALREYLRSA